MRGGGVGEGVCLNLPKSAVRRGFAFLCLQRIAPLSRLVPTNKGRVL